MRWTRGERSDNIEDRRGESFGGGIPMGISGLGIGGFFLLLILSLVTGQNFFALFGGGEEVPSQVDSPHQSIPQRTSPQEEELVGFVSFVLDDVQRTWSRELPKMGQEYHDAKLVLFTDAIRSGCGSAQAAMGPFYCSIDHKVYIDLGFYNELKTRFGAPGDFAQAYVIAHELGHHVQNLLGISEQIYDAQQQSPEQAGPLSIRLELQADCLAGIWAASTKRRDILEKGDIEEGLSAAAAVGDDRIQRQTTGRVSPETWTHGSATQRVGWFKRGLESGNLRDCDTFHTALPGIEHERPAVG